MPAAMRTTKTATALNQQMFRGSLSAVNYLSAEYRAALILPWQVCGVLESRKLLCICHTAKCRTVFLNLPQSTKPPALIFYLLSNLFNESITRPQKCVTP